MAYNDGNSVSTWESSDSSWTPSIGLGEDLDDEDDCIWKETPLQASRIEVVFDTFGDILRQKYQQEETLQLPCNSIDLLVLHGSEY